MNVLFVCVANVGRSQVAEAFFNQFSRRRATSAGLRVGDRQGQTLADRSREPEASSTPGHMLQLMRDEEGLELSGNQRTQLTPQLVEQADRVIVIAPEESYPEYLSGDQVEFWDIPDLFGAPYDKVRELKDRIKERVRLLVEETG